MTSFVRIIALLALPFIMAVIGCGSKPASQTPSAAVDAAAEEEAQIAARLEKLTPENRAIAIAQQNCPVSGHRLGSMDGMLIVEVTGRKVALCCEACRQPLLDKPDEFLAKLPPLSGEAGK